MISSKISKISWRSQYSRSSLKKAGGGTTKPADEIEIGSMMIAATVAGSSATILLSTMSARMLPRVSPNFRPYAQREQYGGGTCRKCASTGSETLFGYQPAPAERAPMVA